MLIENILIYSAPFIIHFIFSFTTQQQRILIEKKPEQAQRKIKKQNLGNFSTPEISFVCQAHSVCQLQQKHFWVFDVNGYLSFREHTEVISQWISFQEHEWILHVYFSFLQKQES